MSDIEKKDRTGYCVTCVNLPQKPLPVAANEKGNPCNGCWWTEEKANWKDAMLEARKQ